MKALDGDIDVIAASCCFDTFINLDLGLSIDLLKIWQAQLEATTCTLGELNFSHMQDLHSLQDGDSVAEFLVDESLGVLVYEINDPNEDTKEGLLAAKQGSTEEMEVDRTPQVCFSMELPDGGVLDTLQHSMDPMDVEETPVAQEFDGFVPQFIWALWDLAPAHWEVLHTAFQIYCIAWGRSC